MASAEPKANSELGRLTRLGFSSIAECLLSVPKSYADYTRPQRALRRDMLGTQQYLILTLAEKKALDSSKKPTKHWASAVRVDLSCVDERGAAIKVVIFGNVWPWLEAAPGDVLHLHGEVVEFGNVLSLDRATVVPLENRGRLAPAYKGKSGQVSGEALLNAVTIALERRGALDDAEVLLLAQAGLREEEFEGLSGYPDVRSLLLDIHQPKSVKVGERACAVAHKLALEALVRRSASAKARPPVVRSAITIDLGLLEELIAGYKHPLTGDQTVAIREIVKDLRSAYPMRRLLSGDVGTGKSITFMIPAVVAYDAGVEVAILAPSTLVAEQHVRDLREAFPGLPVCLVLSGDKLGEGICVGTTALLSATKKAKKQFGLVIVDEQHKFSVEQKAALVSKQTNVLEATATAIPRTLALVNFGGMDVSILRECPVKKQIQTRMTGPAEKQQVDDFLAKVVAMGGQVAIVYPLVKEASKAAKANAKVKEGTENSNVLTAGDEWEKLFPGRVGILHGKLVPDEKKKVIARMHAKEIDILVSSLVIEVGVTLPSLRVMLVMEPDRHGLSQLHQLRGRVARNGGKGWMFLHCSGPIQEDAHERLQLLVETSDGFTLSERDMDIRGFGEVEDDGDAQTGTTRALFYGLKLTRADIEKAAERLGFRTAATIAKSSGVAVPALPASAPPPARSRASSPR